VSRSKKASKMPQDVDSDFEDPTDDDNLQQACRALETDGIRFRKVVMKWVFDSPYSTATHHPILAADRGRSHRRGGRHGGCGRRQ
jgi:hypothetical protein